MRRSELIALRSKELRWERLVETLPAALEASGLVADDSASDGAVTIRDHGEAGCTLLVDRAALARRVGLALARRAGVGLEIFEVIGTFGGKRNRFRTTAWKATLEGELKDAEGKELDLEDASQTWGGGTLAAQTRRVLDEFAVLSSITAKTLRIGYRKKARGRPSSPRVAQLLASLQKAKTFVGQTLPDGRVELKIELAAGGRQSSYCSAEEYEELQRLL
jgi:hypothetical protein